MTDQTDRALDQTVSRIDLLLLAPAMTEAQTITGCEMAKQFGLAGVIVKPCFVHQAVNELKTSSVTVGAVIGYPHGGHATSVKLHEAKRALTEDAHSLEVSLNLGYLIGCQTALVLEDLRAVSGLAHMNEAQVWVILAVDLMSEEKLKTGSRLAVQAGVDGITLTLSSEADEFGLSQVGRVREAVGAQVELKVMGDSLTISQAGELLDAGSDRVGLSKLY